MILQVQVLLVTMVLSVTYVVPVVFWNLVGPLILWYPFIQKQFSSYLLWWGDLIFFATDLHGTRFLYSKMVSNLWSCDIHLILISMQPLSSLWSLDPMLAFISIVNFISAYVFFLFPRNRIFEPHAKFFHIFLTYLKDQNMRIPWKWMNMSLHAYHASHTSHA